MVATSSGLIARRMCSGKCVHPAPAGQPREPGGLTEVGGDEAGAYDGDVDALGAEVEREVLG